MSEQPLVSVCIPAYQAETHLAQTLRSVLAQTYPRLEILVLDNACTDATPQILAGFDDPRLRVVRNETVLPLADNWNHLVALARGELVKVVCADDLVHPDIVSQQVAVLVENPQVALVSCRRHLISERSSVLAARRGLAGLTGLHSGRTTVRRVVRHGGNPIGEPACALFRRDHFDAVGGFDASLVFPMDIDLWVRLLRHGDFFGMAQALAAFRAGTGSISSNLSAAQYADQRKLTDRIGSDPFWQVGTTSRLLGRAGSLSARAKHRALFGAAALTERIGGPRRAHSGTDLDWLD